MSIIDVSKLAFQEYAPAKVNFDAHTMPHGDLQAYVTSKLSNEQMEVLLDPEMVDEITVLGLPADIAAEWLQQHNYAVAQTYIRESRKDKKYNNIRSTMFDCHKDGRRHVFFNAFPTREYVFQVTDVVGAFSNWKMNQACKVKALIFPEMEDLKWTVFADVEQYLMPNDFVVFGVVDTISENLVRAKFKIGEVRHFGRNGMFACFRVSAADGTRSALFVASKETYWGSGLARYCEILVESGVAHIVYCAKAGRFHYKELAHQIFIPTGYWAIDKDSEGKEKLINVSNDSLKSLFKSEFHHLCFHAEMGVHLSVPSVVGETKEQEECYKACGPATIDNEISYAARAIQEMNRKVRAATTFDTAHFITDILNQRHSEADLTAPVPRLADKEEINETLKKEKRRKFELISSWVAAAIMSNGHLETGTGSVIMKTMTEPEYVTAWVANIKTGSASPVDAANFLLAFIWWYAYGGINGDMLAKELIIDARKLAERYGQRPEAATLKDSVFLLESALMYYEFRRDHKLKHGDDWSGLSAKELQQIQTELDKNLLARQRDQFEKPSGTSNIFALQCAIYGDMMLVLNMYAMVVAVCERNKKKFHKHQKSSRKYIENYLSSRTHIADLGDQAVNTSNFHRDATNATLNIQKYLAAIKLDWEFAPFNAQFESPNEIWKYFKAEQQNYSDSNRRTPSFLMYEMFFFTVSMMRGGCEFDDKEQILFNLREFLKVETQRNWAYDRLKDQEKAFVEADGA